MNEGFEIKQRILNRASEMFNEFGLSKVTMEEIAMSLGISKKTLYKYFSNKEHLLRELIHDRKCVISGKIGSILSNTQIAFIEKLQELLSYLATVTGEMHQRLQLDIIKFYPDLWMEIKEFRKKNALSRVAAFIKEGAEQGIIRDDINQDLITLIYIGAIHSLDTPEAYDRIQIGVDRMHSDALKVIYEGILSEKGRSEFLARNVLTTPKEPIV